MHTTYSNYRLTSQYICIFSNKLFQGTTSYCDEVTSSNPNDAVSANEYCGDDAVGFAETCEANGYRYYITSATPSHQAEYDQVMANPNSRCKYGF